MLVLGTFDAYAFEPIPITVSGTMNNTQFDGKWTFEYEWKPTSLNIYDYDDYTQIILRSAHQGDYVYLFLDPITDMHPDELQDYAMVCFDSKNDKTVNSDANDYCFSAYLNGNSTAYQGGYASEENSGFAIIPNPDGFVGKSAISDENDRYTPVPHPSYEFRIPTDLIGRESVYGFYFLVHDAHLQKSYTYPQNIQSTALAEPDKWGEIYSPDKSLPEFGLPLMSLVVSLAAIAFLTRIKHRITL